VTLQSEVGEETSFAERWGVPVLAAVILVGLLALAYVALVRTRRYGRLLSQRPSWEGRNREEGQR
jgi:hypothetical protein